MFDPFPAQLPIPKEGQWPGMPRLKMNWKCPEKMGSKGVTQHLHLLFWCWWCWWSWNLLFKKLPHQAGQAGEYFFKRPAGSTLVGFCWNNFPFLGFQLAVWLITPYENCTKISCFLVIYVAQHVYLTNWMMGISDMIKSAFPLLLYPNVSLPTMTLITMIRPSDHATYIIYC